MKITILGIVVFIVLVVAFFAWFGGPPTTPDAPYMARRGFGRAWIYCALLFVAGAGTACFGDQEYGMFPPTSLRWLFIIFGVFIMAVSTAWMHSLTKALTPNSSASLLPTPHHATEQETGARVLEAMRMDKATFSKRLQEVTAINREFAARYISNHLPDSNRYLVRLNQSCDDNLRPGEHVFPGDTDPVAPLAAAETVDLLCRENRVPEWIDISVERTDSEHTYILLLCCGRFTDDETLLYYEDTGLAPFGCKSPSFPPRWSEEQGKFDLHSRRALA